MSSDTRHRVVVLALDGVYPFELGIPARILGAADDSASASTCSNVMSASTRMASVFPAISVLLMGDHIGSSPGACAGAPANGRIGATYTSTVAADELIL